MPLTGRVTDPALGAIWNFILLIEVGGLAVNWIWAMNGVGPAVWPVIITEAASARLEDRVRSPRAISRMKCFMRCSTALP